MKIFFKILILFVIFNFCVSVIFIRFKTSFHNEYKKEENPFSAVLSGSKRKGKGTKKFDYGALFTAIDSGLDRMADYMEHNRWKTRLPSKGLDTKY